MASPEILDDDYIPSREVAFSSDAGAERRGGFRYPSNGQVFVQVGRRWCEAHLVDRSCSGFQIAIPGRRPPKIDTILLMRSESGEHAVRVARISGSGDLGLEWIGESTRRRGREFRIGFVAFGVLIGLTCGLLRLYAAGGEPWDQLTSNANQLIRPLSTLSR